MGPRSGRVGWGMLPRYPVESGAEGACSVGTGRVTGTWGLGVQTEVYIKPGNGKNGKEYARRSGDKGNEM